MGQPSLFSPPSLSVSELTRYLRQLLESDELLQDVWATGEISNLRLPDSGHVYFTLKDSFAALRCVIWRSTAQRIGHALANGQAIEAHGAIGVYERDGQYQLYVDGVRPAGQGWLYQEFLRLKARLEAEGLFAPERKRPLPSLPRCIGIVTSPTGAALQDMLNTLRNRYPLAEVILAPTLVQGEEAPQQIAAALRALDQSGLPDVILVARGGGSLEDLWAFNDERVVYAIADSHIPVVTGIGHETDFTGRFRRRPARPHPNRRRHAGHARCRRPALRPARNQGLTDTSIPNRYSSISRATTASYPASAVRLAFVPGAQ